MKLFLPVTLSVLLVLAGCSRETQVSVNFTQPQAVKTGDPVQFNGQVIGDVSGIDDTESGVLLRLDLDPQKLDGLDEGSVAMVISQPVRRVELYSTGTGQALQSGARIRGMNNALELASWTAGHAMEAIQEMLNTAARELNTMVQSQDWEALARQFNETVSNLGDQSNEALGQIGTELEKFIKNLQAQSTETLDQADRLSEQLNEQIQQFQQQGSLELARMLQEILDSLNAMTDPGAAKTPEEENGQPL